MCLTCQRVNEGVGCATMSATFCCTVWCFRANSFTHKRIAGNCGPLHASIQSITNSRDFSPKYLLNPVAVLHLFHFHHDPILFWVESTVSSSLVYLHYNPLFGQLPPLSTARTFFTGSAPSDPTRPCQSASRACSFYCNHTVLTATQTLQCSLPAQALHPGCSLGQHILHLVSWE